MKTKRQIVSEHWEMFVRETPEQLFFISVAMDVVMNPPADLPHCARIIIPIAEPGRNGGPQGEESERLWQMEDALCAVLHDCDIPNCVLAGRMTYAGWRELVFLHDDWDAFRPPVGGWMQQHPDYAIDVDESEGPGFCNDYLRPTLADQFFILDNRVIRNLVEQGSNPELPHDLEYFFRGEPAALAQLREQLGTRGYRTGDASQPGELLMVKTLPLHLPLVVQESLANHELASTLGADMDGWGAAVVN